MPSNTPASVASELLQALADEIPTKHAGPETQGTEHANRQRFDIEEFIGRHRLEVDGPHDWNGKQGRGKRWAFTKSPMCEHDDGAAHIEQHASGAITAGCLHNSCKWTWQELRARFDSKPDHASSGRPAARLVAAPKPARPAAPVEVYRPFPVEALPEPLRGFVYATAEAMVCDASYVVLPSLAALAAAIGSTATSGAETRLERARDRLGGRRGRKRHNQNAAFPTGGPAGAGTATASPGGTR
jgi:hypothetical protein